MPRTDHLGMLPYLPAVARADGRVVLTQKFLDGMRVTKSLWGGPVTCVLEPVEEISDNLDNVEVDVSDLPFDVQVLAYDDPALRDVLAKCSVVHVGLSWRTTEIASLCREVGVACVYLSEYSLLTRMQVIRAETFHPLRRARRYLWERGLEQRQRRAVALAEGIQCNGTPTFDAYREISPSPLLYFDSRTEAEMLQTERGLEARLERARSGAPLRLAFSGRLNAIKGADHLPLVARELARRGVDFQLEIFGDGDLVPAIRAELAARGLEDRVQLRGVLDFRSELAPYVRDNVDLFVCCHRQGDPACTYLETFACGVPIVGYANEALEGLLERVDAGVTAPMDRPGRLAEKIAELDRDRSGLAALSRNALAFAQDHTFETTFQRRIDHLRSVVHPRDQRRSA